MTLEERVCMDARVNGRDELCAGVGHIDEGKSYQAGQGEFYRAILQAGGTGRLRRGVE
jgi:hypothetical protein